MPTSIEGHRAPDAASGLPAGGLTGQLLQKNSSANFDAAWTDPPEGGGTGGGGEGGGLTQGQTQQFAALFETAVWGDVANPDTLDTGITVSVTGTGTHTFTATVAGGDARDIFRRRDAFRLAGDADTAALLVTSIDDASTVQCYSAGSPTEDTPANAVRWRGEILSVGQRTPSFLGGNLKVYAVKDSGGNRMLVLWTGNNPGWFGPANGTAGGFAGPASAPNASGFALKPGDPAVYTVTGTDSNGDLILAALPPWVPAPANANDPGLPGQIACDSAWFYLCVAAGTWVRAALATW